MTNSKKGGVISEAALRAHVRRMLLETMLLNEGPDDIAGYYPTEENDTVASLFEKFYGYSNINWSAMFRSGSTTATIYKKALASLQDQWGSEKFTQNTILAIPNKVMVDGVEVVELKGTYKKPSQNILFSNEKEAKNQAGIKEVSKDFIVEKLTNLQAAELSQIFPSGYVIYEPYKQKWSIFKDIANSAIASIKNNKQKLSQDDLSKINADDSLEPDKKIIKLIAALSGQSVDLSDVKDILTYAFTAGLLKRPFRTSQMGPPEYDVLLTNIKNIVKSAPAEPTPAVPESTKTSTGTSTSRKPTSSSVIKKIQEIIGEVPVTGKWTPGITDEKLKVFITNKKTEIEGTTIEELTSNWGDNAPKIKKINGAAASIPGTLSGVLKFLNLIGGNDVNSQSSKTPEPAAAVAAPETPATTTTATGSTEANEQNVKEKAEKGLARVLLGISEGNIKIGTKGGDVAAENTVIGGGIDAIGNINNKTNASGKAIEAAKFLMNNLDFTPDDLENLASIFDITKLPKESGGGQNWPEIIKLTSQKPFLQKIRVYFYSFKKGGWKANADREDVSSAIQKALGTPSK